MTTGIYNAAITCGGACWHAQESKCVCSCAGANHGRLTGLDESAAAAKQPERRRRVGQTEYRLIAVLNTRSEAMSYCKARGVRYVRVSNRKYSEPELLLISKMREPQERNWPECKGFRRSASGNNWLAPHIVWARADYDVQEPVKCESCGEYAAPFDFIVIVDSLDIESASLDSLRAITGDKSFSHQDWRCPSYDINLWRGFEPRLPLRK